MDSRDYWVCNTEVSGSGGFHRVASIWCPISRSSSTHTAAGHTEVETPSLSSAVLFKEAAGTRLPWPKSLDWLAKPQLMQDLRGELLCAHQRGERGVGVLEVQRGHVWCHYEVAAAMRVMVRDHQAMIPDHVLELDQDSINIVPIHEYYAEKPLPWRRSATWAFEAREWKDARAKKHAPSLP